MLMAETMTVIVGDLWCYSFESQKWKFLSGSGGTTRKAHQMWIARDKLYIYGGERLPESARSVHEAHSIRDFEYFDLQERTWNTLRCAGDDPWELSEFCCLPLYYGQEEPSAVLIWGGYCEIGNVTTLNLDIDKYTAMYGDEASEIGLPYRKRLLRFDLDTHVFTNLKPTVNTLNPLAQCIAAEMRTENGVTNIIFGEGYGISPHSKGGMGDSMEFPDELRQEYEDAGMQIADKGVKPKVNHGLYKVMIHDHRETSAADKGATGIGWEWEFASMKGDQRPATVFLLNVGSPVHHWQQFFHEDDFRNPPSGEIQDNDEATNLGQRVILHSLKKADLNGSLGRCGPWLEDTERYHVLICDQAGKPKRQISVRSANLRYIAAAANDVLLSKCKSSRFHIGPLKVQPFWMRSGMRSKRMPLEDLLDDRPDRPGNISLAHDTYNGPLSAKARAVVEYVGERESKSGSISLQPIVAPMKNRSNEKREYFRKFIESQRLADQARVDSWQKNILSSRDTSKWKDFLRLEVSIDGLKPAVRRELLVSPFVTIERLYKQVLCPALGWTSNLHTYALRRVDMLKPDSDVLKGLEEECWIAASFSTALDAIHRPFYIGGAVVDDREILLGDLFYSSKDDACTLQWVHDLGDWWSHTIEVFEDLSKQQAETSAAVLLSGSGACPPEGAGGVVQYSSSIRKSSLPHWFGE
jgi:hypothetical protein